MLLHYRHAGARENRRRWSFQHTINLGSLREVSDLSRATVVGDGGQQVILDHRAQRHVGTEFLRLPHGPLGQLVYGVFSRLIEASLMVGLLIIAAFFSLILVVLVSQQRMARAF